MSWLGRHHRTLGWLIAAAWLGAAVLLLSRLPDIELLGEHRVFLGWAPFGAPLAILSWLWAFGPQWRSRRAILVLAIVASSWFLLAAIGEGGRLNLATRDAFFLRQRGLEVALRSVLWLYLLHPLAIMTAGCLAVVEYLRYPPKWVRHSILADSV